MALSLLPMGALAANEFVKNGDTSYASLADAIIAANNGDTLIVQTGFDEPDSGNVTVNLGGPLTLDLNGKTVKVNITLSGSAADLSVVNGTIDGIILLEGTKKHTVDLDCGVTGKVRVEGSAYTVNIGENANVAGGIEMAGTASGSTVNIPSGSAGSSDSNYGVVAAAGTLNITGGTFNGKTNSINVANGVTAQVTGGTFNASVGGNATKFITGGTFSVQPDAKYIADGYGAYEEGDNWKVGPAYTVTLDKSDGPITIKGPLNGATRDLNTSEIPKAPKGYSFTGYYTSAEGGEQFYDATGKCVGTSDADIIVYPQYSGDTKTVTLNADGGTIADGKNITSYVVGVGATLPTAEDVTKTGYTFAGWYLDNDSSKLRTEIPATAVKDLSYTAHWNPIIFTIRFYGEDGVTPVEADGAGFSVETATSTTIARTPVAPSVVGKTFVDWETASGLTHTKEKPIDLVEAFNDVKQGDDGKYYLDLNAVYSTNEYRVAFNAGTNGTFTDATEIEGLIYDSTLSSDQIASYNVPFGATVTKFPTATKEGYNLVKWYLASDAEKTSVTEVTVNADTLQDNQVVLWSEWEAKTYKVTLDNQGGSEAPASVDRVYGNYGANLSPLPTKEGYTFEGYYTEPNGAGTKYYDSTGLATVQWKLDDEDVTLYANWTANDYSIVYDPNGGGSESKSQGGFIYGVATALKSLTELGFSRSGYSFAGWTADKDGTTPETPIADGGLVTGVELNIASSGFARIYAQWQANEYTITYVLDGGTNNPENPDKYSYSATNSIALKAPTKDGYTFKGWSANAETYNPANSIAAGQTGDITRYAFWDENTYKVNYYPNFGENKDPVPSSEKKYSVTFELWADPVTNDNFKNAGHTFTGWNTAANGSGVTYKPGQTVSKLAESGTFDLYAQWTPIGYNVTVNTEGVTGGTVEVSKTTANINDVITVTPKPIEGYVIDRITCTYEVEDDTNLHYVEAAKNDSGFTFTMPGADVTVTPVVSPASYSIYWNSNYPDGTNTVIGPGQRSTTDAKEFPEASQTGIGFEKAGYTFAGWSLTAEPAEGDTLYKPGDPEYKATENGATINFYAQWTPIEYTIKYNLDGGTVPEGANPTTYTVETEPFTLVSPTKEGSTFLGWSLEGQEEVHPTLTIKGTNKANYSLVAKWADTAWDLTLPYTQGTLTKDDNNVVNGAKFENVTLSFSSADPRIGRMMDGYWVGYKFIAPEAVTAENIANTTYSNDGGKNWRNFNNAKDGQEIDGRYYMQAWVPLTVESVEAFVNAHQTMKWTYKFAWDGNQDNAQTFVIEVSPQNVTLNKSADTDPQIKVVNWEIVDKNEYFDVTFDVDGATNPTSIATQSVRFNQKATAPETSPVKEGYNFLGWFAKGEEDAYNFDTPVKANVALKAQWEKQTFTVNFFDTDGTTSLSAPQTVEYGAKATQPANPEKVGYTFDKWMTKATESVVSAAYDFAAAVTANLDLVASWTGNTVKYTFANVADSDIATKITNYNSETNSVSFVVGNKDAFTLPADLTKTGYDFQGWTWKEQPKAQKEVTIPKDDPYNYAFIANWQAKTYEVALDSQFADLTPDPEKIIVTYNAAYGNLPTLTKDGFVFKGWYSDPTAEDAIYKIEADTTVVEPVPTTLYAHWAGKTVNYTYAGIEGATFEGGTNPTERTVGTEGFTLANPAKAGYTFLGWTWTGHDQKETTVRIEANDPYNYDFVANWEIIPAVAPAITVSTVNESGSPAPYGTGIEVKAVYDLEEDTYIVADYTWTVNDAAGNPVGETKLVVPEDGTIANYTLPATTPVGTYTVSCTANFQRTDNGKSAVAASNVLTLEVTPAAVTITPDEGQSKVYGENDPAEYTYSSEGLVGSDAITGALARVAGEVVGTYAYLIDGLTAGDNYSLSLAENSPTFAITAKPLTDDDITVTLTPSKDTFTGEKQQPIVMVTDGDKVLKEGTDYTIDLPKGDTALINVGKHTITLTGMGNYGDKTTVDFEITKATPVLTKEPEAIDRTYDGKWSALVTAGEATGGTFEYSLTGNANDYSTDIPLAKNAGNYTVFYRIAADENYTSDGTGKVDVTISPRVVELSWGDTSFTYTAGVKQAPTCTINNIAPDDADTTGKDDVSIVVTGEQENAGAYTATATLDGTAKNNYALPENNTIGFSITPIAPEVAVTAKDLTYNKEAQELVTGEVSEGCTIEYSTDGTSWSSNVPTGTNAGDYTVYYRVIGNGNYANVDKFGPVENVTIKKAPISPDVEIEGWTYGDEAKEPSIKEGTNPGNGAVTYDYYSIDRSSGSPVFTKLTEAPKDAGEYRAYANVAATDNYLGAPCFKDFTIEQLVAELQWSDTTQTYTGQDLSPTATVANLVDGDNCVVTVIVTQKNSQNHRVGEYTATATDLSNKNYKLPDQNPTTTLTITPAPVTVTWDPASPAYTYNGQGQAPTPTAEGLFKDVTITVNYTDEQGNTSNSMPVNAGQYTATAVLSGAARENFEITEGASIDFTIAKAKLSASVANVSIYYGSDPATVDFNYVITYAGFVGNDTESAVSGTLTCQHDYQPTMDVGDYYFHPSGLTSDNYEIEYVKDADQKIGVLTVLPKPVTLSWPDPSQFDYDGNPYARAVELVGLVNDDAVKPAVKFIDYTDSDNPVDVEQAVDAGTYRIVVTGLTGDKSNNYQLPTDEGQLANVFTINKGENEITTVTAEGWTYGADPVAPVVTATFDADKATFTYSTEENGTYSSDVPTDAGTYYVKATIPESRNYNAVTSDPASFTIAPAALTVTADNNEKVYGAIDPALTYTVAGLIGEDTAETVLNGLLSRGEGEDVGPYEIGSGTLEIAEGVVNYVLAAESWFTTGTFTITKADAAVIKAPEAKTGLKAGSAQDLVTAGEATGGTMVYSESADGTFTSTIPQKSAAGTYNVYYKVQGDANHNDTAVAGPIPVTVTSNSSGGGGGGGGGGGSTSYTVTAASTPNGSASVKSGNNSGASISVSSGASVVVTPTPAANYKVDTVTATYGAKNTSVTLTDNKDGTYQFKMPNGNVTVTATFVKDPDADPNNDPTTAQETIKDYSKDYEKCDQENNTNCPMNAYDDADPEEWYHDGVHYCIENKIMQGYDDGFFYPDKATTRAQLVQVLYNIAGQPKVTSDKSYSDVKAGAWYYAAIQWASKNDIVSGYNDGKFRPDDPITREQIARILMGFAKYLGYDTSATSDLKGYDDVSTVSSWATEYVKWAVGAGVYCGPEGSNTLLGANGNTIRSELATMMMNFCTKLAK